MEEWAQLREKKRSPKQHQEVVVHTQQQTQARHTDKTWYTRDSRHKQDTPTRRGTHATADTIKTHRVHPDRRVCATERVLQALSEALLRRPVCLELVECATRTLGPIPGGGSGNI
jgi:hypothetical protein